MTDSIDPSPRPTYVAGETDDLRSVLAAFEDRTEGLILLAGNVESLIVEVRGLRKAVEARPSRYEVDRKRRRAIVALALYTLIALFAIDAHAESCGPGTRVAGIVEAFLDGEEAEIAREIGQRPPSSYCDLVVPIHDHNRNGWPGPHNVVGIVLYLGAFVGLLWWANLPWRHTHYDEAHPTEPKDKP